MFFGIVVDKKKIVLYTILMALLIISIVWYNAYEKPVPSSGIVKEEIPVPILMYHSVCKDTALTCDYIVSLSMFKEDMMYLKKNGYSTIFVSDLVAYVYHDKPLPDKAVIITFDDGFLNNLIYVLPILESLDMKAVISIVGDYSETYSEDPNRNLLYAYLTWDDIKELEASGRIEIGNHTYNMHQIGARRGCMKKYTESNEEYHQALNDNIGKFQAILTKKTGITPSVFAYPYGFVSEESTPIIKEMGFKAALTCNEKINYLTKDPEQLYHLSRFNRPANISTEEFMKKITVE